MKEDIYHEKEIKELNSHELFNNAIYGSYFKLKPQHYVYQG
jgi:predicted small secreted protein